MSDDLYETGLDIRKAVVGEKYVNSSIDNADDFNGDFQRLVTEYCWGAVWGRDDLDRKSRSMLNIAMLSALNRPHELRLHVQGAIRNGVSRVEVREILMQVAIYCGVPAAVDGFRIAKAAMDELDEESSKA